MPSIKEMKNGKHTGRWTSRFYHELSNGERKQVYKRGFAKKSDADNYEREFLLTKEGNPSMEFQSLVDDYIADSTNRIRESTLKIKKSCFRNHITPFFQFKPVDQITKRDIRRWQNNMLKLELKPTYLRRINTELNAIFSYAVDVHGLRDNPTKNLKKIGKRDAEGLNFWTVDEFNTFIDYFYRDDKPINVKYRTVFSLLFYSGMRIGELQALTLNDIDFDKGTIRINKTYYKQYGKEVIAPPKTVSSNREVAIPQPIMDLIKNYINVLYKPQPHERIFLYSRTSYAKYMKMISTEMGLKKIRIHDLRHSHASHLISLGCDPLVIQERLGHKDVEVTLNTYSHLYPNKQNEVAKLLEEKMRAN